MSPLLAPILAQLVTLGAGDRTEARVIFSEGERTTEATTSPLAALNVDWRHFSIGAAYFPSLTLRPLESSPRELDVAHLANLDLTYKQSFKRTTLTISESARYTQQNLYQDALAPRPVETPNQQGQTPDQQQPGGTGNQPEVQQPTDPNVDTRGRALDKEVRYGVLTTSIIVDQTLSSISTVGGSVQYYISSGLDEETRDDYPFVTGETISFYGEHALNRNDSARGELRVSHARVPDQAISWLSVADATFKHRFSKRTTGDVSAGVSATLTELPNGLEIISIYPTFGAGIVHGERIGRGMLTLDANASSAPVLDITTGLVDPRLTVDGGAVYTLDRFSVSSNVSAAISLNEEADALNSIFADLVLAYDLGAGFAIDTGVRAGWETLGGATLVPPSWAAFAGISYRGAIPLKKRY
jgi:hypothetical protein